MKTAIGNYIGRKASAVNRVILSSLSLPGAQPHLKYDKLAKESYERNSAVYAVVHGIATAASTVNWVAYDRGRSSAKSARRFRRVMSQRTFRKTFLYAGPNRYHVQKHLDTTEVSDAPLLKLIERPNPLQAQAGYIQALSATWLISGNAYEEFLKTGERGATPREMYVLRPDRTSVLDNSIDNRRQYPDLAKQVKPDELVLGFEYSTDGGPGQKFPATSVIHRKNFHPTDDFYGLSPLMPSRRAWETDNLAADWNQALIKNQARPSGALIAPQTVGDDAYLRLKAEIQETYLGQAGLPIFLEGGLDWKQLSLSPIELDWMEGRIKNREEVCAVYGWPVELIGGEKKFNTFAEARKAGWTDAVLPLLDAIRDEWNARVAPLFGDTIFLDYDRDTIDALAEDLQRVYLRVSSADWLTLNEQRDATGYESSEHEDADTPRALLKSADPFGGGAPQIPNDDAKTPEGDRPLVQGEENPMNPESGSDAAARKAADATLRAVKAGQRLNAYQKRQLNKLRVSLRRLFNQQGTELAAHAAQAIREEL
jgi:HK97 family phage portal protein